MALITCIECKSKISSLAQNCPVCGCPSEYQDNTLLHDSNVENLMLRNQSAWESVKKLALSGAKKVDATDEIRRITGTTSANDPYEIVNCIISTGELPVDLIIQKFPHQSPRCDSLVDSEISDKLKYPDLWLSILKDVKNGYMYDASKKLTNLAGASRSLSDAIIDEIQKYGNIPMNLILQKLPSQRFNSELMPCLACGKTISAKAETCPYCGHPTGVHVCPRCGSTEIMWIDGVSKALSMAFFGPFSVNTVRNKYECEKCHFKF